MIAALSQAAWAGNKPDWIELRSPNFIVVSNANDGQARRVARQFEMIRAVFREYFGRSGTSTEQPVLILAAKDENTLKALIPEFWAKRGLSHPAGVCLDSAESDYIALRLDVSLNQEAYEPFEPVYHEYVHYLTRQLIAKLPLWMVEGLAEFYGNTRFESKVVYLGAPSATNILLLKDTPLLPVSALFAIDRNSPYYHEQSKTSIFYAESWALTHYLIARDWNEKTHRTNDFVRLVETGMDPTTAAAQTIGDPAALEGQLRAYVHRLSFTAAGMKPPTIDETAFRLRAVSDAEALAVRADFMAHDQHYSEAQQMLQEALNGDPKLDVAYEGLAYLALQQNNAAEAEKWSAQALALNPESYRANYYYAWSLLRQGTADPAKAAKAEQSLRAVIKYNPDFVPAYDSLAYVLVFEGGKEKLDEAYMMTLQAVTREPGNMQYRLRAVEVLERQHRADDAVRVATLAVSMAKTPQEQQTASEALASAQQFKESWAKMQALQNSAASHPGQEAAESEESPRPTLVPRMNRQINVTAGLLLLSDPQGIDFNSYLNRDVMSKIQKAWAAEIQKVGAIAAVKKGTVVLEFAIEKDGSISRIKLQQSTNEDQLDQAVGSALQAASPFPPLPANYRGKEIRLRFQCNYNAATADAGASGPGK